MFAAWTVGSLDLFRVVDVDLHLNLGILEAGAPDLHAACELVLFAEVLVEDAQEGLFTIGAAARLPEPDIGAPCGEQPPAQPWRKTPAIRGAE